MIAFVLSGGASLGAIEVGMLRALYERGIAPELIVGTSAGAVSNFDHAAELIERGHESAKRALDDPDPAAWTPRSLALLRPHAH